MLSFEKAVKQGLPIELDIQNLSDGSLAVFHDRSLLRLCGEDSLIKNKDRKTIKNLSLLGTSERIPLLSEVLEIVNGKVPLLIEIKNFGWPGETEKQTAAILKPYKGEFAVQSFNPFSIRWFRLNAPDFCRGQLATAIDYHDVDYLRLLALRYLAVSFISMPDFIGYDIDCIPNFPAKIVKRLGLPLLAWTVSRPDQLEKARLYCDNIIFENINPDSFNKI